MRKDKLFIDLSSQHCMLMFHKWFFLNLHSLLQFVFNFLNTDTCEQNYLQGFSNSGLTILSEDWASGNNSRTILCRESGNSERIILREDLAIVAFAFSIWYRMFRLASGQQQISLQQRRKFTVSDGVKYRLFAEESVMANLLQITVSCTQVGG